MRAHFFSLTVLLGLLSACSTPDKLTLTPTRFEQVEGWQEDDHAEALRTFLASCQRIDMRAPDDIWGKNTLAAPNELWQSVCAEAKTVPEEQAREFFEAQFTPYRAGNNGGEEGLFTGYYEPLLDASPTRSARFHVPVYQPPPELSKEPYFTHAEINAGALAGRDLEIAWVDDPIALFFAQIQGSARIRYPDGSVRRIGYAGKNNRAYVALGKVLMEEGYLEKENVNLFTIRDWLASHPEQAQAMMERNPSYVFFRMLDGDGVVGAEGSMLTPGRSLAVDGRFIPYGSPLFLATDLPPTAYTEEQPFQRLMVAQDTGGAIRGPVRGDIFFGPGKLAEALAGVLKSKGRYTLLVPNAIRPEP